MSNGDEGGRRMQGPGIQSRVTVNLNELPTVSCPTCGGQIFNTSVAMFKKVSAVVAGKAMLIKVELSSCIDCGALVQVVGDELKLVKLEKIPEKEPPVKLLR